MSATETPLQNRPSFEILTAQQLAERLALPESWVREMTRSRTPNPIPHLRFGRYVRFQWGSPQLSGWINDRLRGGTQSHSLDSSRKGFK
jgi:hypothetical protein